MVLKSLQLGESVAEKLQNSNFATLILFQRVSEGSAKLQTVWMLRPRVDLEVPDFLKSGKSDPPGVPFGGLGPPQTTPEVLRTPQDPPEAPRKAYTNRMLRQKLSRKIGVGCEAGVSKKNLQKQINFEKKRNSENQTFHFFVFFFSWPPQYVLVKVVLVLDFRILFLKTGFWSDFSPSIIEGTRVGAKI